MEGVFYRIYSLPNDKGSGRKFYVYRYKHPNSSYLFTSNEWAYPGWKTDDDAFSFRSRAEAVAALRRADPNYQE